MTGFAGTDAAAVLATWTAAVVTLTILAYLAGERRLFRLLQHLLAGLATGYLVVLAVREVIVPRLIEPLSGDPAGNILLWPAAVLVAGMVVARWLPRRAAALPVALLVAGTAAFALGGAVAGTLLPQVADAVVPPDSAPPALASGVAALGVTSLVVLSFLHGAPRGRLVGGAVSTGRWLLLAGIGGFLGFLVVSRLALLVDRLTFLLGDWLGLV